MQVRSIILAVVGALLVLVSGKLFLDSRGPAEPALKDAELEDALSRYRRNHAPGEETSARPTPVVPRRRPAIDRTVKPEIESEPETFTAPPPEEQEAVFTGQLDLKNQLNEANRLYDKADYEGSREAALEVLGSHPNNVRMLRIVVSSSCIMAEEEMAVRYYQSLPDRDKRQMARRCERFGIKFDESQ